jgi:hypothetical protein
MLGVPLMAFGGAIITFKESLVVRPPGVSVNGAGSRCFHHHPISCSASCLVGIRSFNIPEMGLMVAFTRGVHRQHG